MTTNIGAFFLARNAAGGFRIKQRQLPIFRQLKCIDEADPLKWLIPTRRLEKLVFDIQRRDVVREQHHLIAVEFGLILVGLTQSSESSRIIRTIRLPVPTNGSNDMHTGIGERSVDILPPKISSTTSHHEIDNRLRRVDDTCVCPPTSTEKP